MIAGVVSAAALATLWSQRPDLVRSLGLFGGGPPVDCRGLVGEPEHRLDDCLADFSRARLSDEAEAQIQVLAGRSRILSIADVQVDNVAFTPMSEVMGLREAMLGRDEAKVAALLRDKGILAVVIDRDLTQALDREGTVLSRLAQHDHLEWFQLLRVTDELMVYDVRGTIVRVPDASGQALLTALRARIEGKPHARQAWQPDAIRLMGGLRLQGNLLALRHAAANDMEAALDELAAKLVREWTRDVEPDGHGPLRDRLDDLRLEVWVVMERAAVEPRSQEAVFELWELGVDGMMLRQPPGVEDDHFTYMPGSEALTHSIRSPDSFLRHATRQFGWYHPRPWEADPRTQLDLIRTQHFIESTPGGGPAQYLFRGMPEVAQASIDDAEIQRMLIEGAEWWVYNQYPNGGFEYKYWPVQNRRSTEYNEVRHILAARDLADAWRYRHDPRYLEASKRSMDWLLTFAVHDTSPRDPELPHPPEGSMLFRYPSRELAAQTGGVPNQKLGTVAVALLGWVAWAQATGSHEQDENIRKMARFTLAMLEPDGRFRPYYVQPGHRYENERNDIVPGEAALALGMVAEYFDEPEWVAFYPKFLAYYRPWFRERAARQRPTGRWPHDTYANQDRLDLVQFGPWSVMAAHQVYRLTGDEEAAAFGLEVADWMIDNYQWSEARSPWPDYVGGYYKLPNELPAMQTFCYSEGTAAAWGIANRFAPDRAHKYETATREAIRFLQVMQFDPSDSYFVARPEKIRGGIKYAMNENKVRIDYVGHGLSTLSQSLDVRASETDEPLEVRDPAEYATVPVRGPSSPEAPVDESGGESDSPDDSE